MPDSGIWFGIGQVAAIVCTAIGGGIVSAAIIVKLSRFIGYEQPART